MRIGLEDIKVAFAEHKLEIEQTARTAEALVESGVPFRDAHEQIAGQVRAGTFEPVERRARLAPGPAEVSAAVAEARARVL